MMRMNWTYAITKAIFSSACHTSCNFTSKSQKASSHTANNSPASQNELIICCAEKIEENMVNGKKESNTQKNQLCMESVEQWRGKGCLLITIQLQGFKAELITALYLKISFIQNIFFLCYCPLQHPEKNTLVWICILACQLKCVGQICLPKNVQIKCTLDKLDLICQKFESLSYAKKSKPWAQCGCVSKERELAQA